MLNQYDLKASDVVICVVGLGYVGLPLAIKFSTKFNVIGFDVDNRKIELLKKGIDYTGEVKETINNSERIVFTNDPKEIGRADIIIVAVPTPIDKLRNPDLSFLKKASELVGKHMKKGVIVVYESTVYPGATEEICIPILEKASGLKWKKDFWVGYSPERINPGDKVHTLENVVKIVAGDTKETTKILKTIYSKIIKAGVYEAPSIKVAEAAKVLENIQRDVNIAVMNEAALIFHRLGIDTKEVIKAASTKWNFVKVEPGLVGGHCIPVDPYYLIYKSILHGYVPELFLSARAVNESIPKFVAHESIKLLIKGNKNVKGAKVLILGITFKENVPDIRNSKVYELIQELKDYEVEIFVYDPVANEEEVFNEFGIKLIKDIHSGKPYDMVIWSVKHNLLVEEISLEILKKITSQPPILVDIKGIFPMDKLEKEGFIYWRL